MNQRWMGLCFLSAILFMVAILFFIGGLWPLTALFGIAGYKVGREAYEEDLRNGP